MKPPRFFFMDLAHSFKIKPFVSLSISLCCKILIGNFGYFVYYSLRPLYVYLCYIINYFKFSIIGWYIGYNILGCGFVKKTIPKYLQFQIRVLIFCSPCLSIGIVCRRIYWLSFVADLFLWGILHISFHNFKRRENKIEIHAFLQKFLSIRDITSVGMKF